MSSPSMTDEEFEREVRTLKDLRRRSVSSAGPGELPVDPDLPPRDQGEVGNAAPPGPQPFSSNDDVTLTVPDAGGDANGLFWVPAHLHPELAPGEFHAFLKSHTHSNPTAMAAGESGEASLARSPSWLARSRTLSSGVKRNKSMLSRQYTPRHGDKIEEEVPVVTRRGSNPFGGEQGPTLQDLQKLDEMVGEVEDDPEQMRQILRRGLSMRLQPGLPEETVQSGQPGYGESSTGTSSSSPRSSSIVRRSARTRIRKGSSVDGSKRYSVRKNRPSTAGSDSVFSDEADGRVSEERRSDETTQESGSSETPDVYHEARDEYRYQPKQQQQAYQSPPQPQHPPPPPPREEDEDQLRRPQQQQPTVSVSGIDFSQASDDEAMIFDAYTHDPHDRTSTSTYGSISSAYDEQPSRSPSPEPPRVETTARHTPILTPIVAPKASDAQWYEDDERTPTQESSMSAAMNAMRINVPPSRSSDNIYQQSASEKLQQQQQHQQQYQQVAPPTGRVPSPPRPAVPEKHDLPSGAAPPRSQTAPPGMSMQQRTGAIPSPIAPIAHVERPPLTRTESNSSAVSVGSTSTPPSLKKEKKGLFGKKSKHHEKPEKPKKEKDRFLGSLFGSKKKHEEATSVSNFSTAGPAAAAALLGTSKSAKAFHHQGSGTSSPTSPGFSNFARYPIHVERAVYRLSHIKLANARRPLIEQVLISNLMFWYLGVIGRTTPAEEKKPGTTNGLDRTRDQNAQQPQLKGTPNKPADSGSAGVKQPDLPQQQQQQQPQHRRAGLSKPERSRTNNAEAAYRAPQYGMQSQMEEMHRSPPKQQAMQQQQQQPQQHHHQPTQHSSHHSQSQQQQPQQPQQQARPQPPPQQQQHSHQHQQQQQQQQEQQQRQQQQLHQQQQYHQPQAASPQPTPRTSSMPGRSRSPPTSQPQQRPEYPPGVAPPRVPQGGQYSHSPNHSQSSQHSQHLGQPGRAPVQPDGRQRVPSGGGGSQQPQQHPGARNSTIGPRPGQGYPQPNGRASDNPNRPIYPNQHAGTKPGQIFQYPGMVAAQQQYQQQQRPPGAGQAYPQQGGGPMYHQQQRPMQHQGPPQGWENQRLPGHQPQPGRSAASPPPMAQTPPRGSSSNRQPADPYGRPYREGQTSPTHQTFYSAQRPPTMQQGQPYPYANGQPRPQAVGSGQYPHHR